VVGFSSFSQLKDFQWHHHPPVMGLRVLGSNTIEFGQQFRIMTIPERD